MTVGQLPGATSTSCSCSPQGPHRGEYHSDLSQPVRVSGCGPLAITRQTWNLELAAHPKVPESVFLGLKQPSCPSGLRGLCGSPASSGKSGPLHQADQPTRQHPPPSILVTRCRFPFSSNTVSTTTGRQGAWAEAGRQTCFVWPSTVLQKNLTWLPTLKSQISHKNPDFWLPWTNQRSLAAPDPYC